jgi:hypothetical protein
LEGLTPAFLQALLRGDGCEGEVEGVEGKILRPFLRREGTFLSKEEAVLPKVGSLLPGVLPKGAP